MNTATVKHLLLDLGGIIEHIEPKLVARAFLKLGMKDPQQFFSLSGQSHICNEFETGRISSEEFIQHIQAHCAPDTSKEAVIDAWNANLLGIPFEAFDTLQTLKNRGFSLYILSNTNPIHVEKILSTFYQYYQTDFYSLFEKVYFSHEVGYRKPSAHFFKFILNHAKLKAEQCLYVDDLQKNLEPAKKLGINVIKHQTNAPIAYLTAFLGVQEQLDSLAFAGNIA